MHTGCQGLNMKNNISIILIMSYIDHSWNDNILDILS